MAVSKSEASSGAGGRAGSVRKSTRRSAGRPRKPQVVPEDSISGSPGRLSVPLTEAGLVDWDSLGGSTRQKVRELLRLNRPPEDEQVGPVIGEQECRSVYAVFGELEAWLAARLWKVPRQLARKVFLYSPQEVELLAGPTSVVLSKRVGPAVAEWKDELALGLFLVSIHQHKVAAMVAAVKLHREEALASAVAEQPVDGRERQEGVSG